MALTVILTAAVMVIAAEPAAAAVSAGRRAAASVEVRTMTEGSVDNLRTKLRSRTLTAQVSGLRNDLVLLGSGGRI
jgi:hypothetical protein